jgi:hypothetical protein
MREYLLSVYQPAGDPPPAAVLDGIRRDLDALNRDIGAAGGWVFAGGLHPPSTATVLRASGDEVLMTDGPFAEAKEHLGGLTIVRAGDLDVALRWARRMAQATTLPIEVRPFRERAG